ncbi:protein LDOC1-like [Thamnophis elegans]|uniref:protein LDOC1-like n=1 Tax=Thamnophis elegans TaxID=35005 RepID=UPI001378150E|nr:protein LDOC1-like [Thamnophis elegans]
MEQLRAENAQLTQQAAVLGAQVAQLQIHTVPSLAQRKCPVAVPDKLDGNQVMFPAFLGQCQLFISLRAEDFPTDRDKVGFMISLVSSSAAHWATPLLVHASPLLDDFMEFCDHLRLMYENPIKMEMAT